MEIKNNIKKVFNDHKNISLERYKSSKLLFIIVTLLFFLNFFFVGASLNDGIFVNTLGYSYTLFVLGLLYYLYYLFKVLFIGREVSWFFKIIILLFVLLFILLLFPIILKGGFNTFVELTNIKDAKNIIYGFIGNIDMNFDFDLNLNIGEKFDLMRSSIIDFFNGIVSKFN